MSKWWDYLLVVICILAIILLAHFAFSQSTEQTIVTPTELEQAKLAKLKAQDATYQQQLKVVEVEMNNLQLTHQIIDQQQKQKHSEFLGYSEEVKRSHNKDWGDAVVFYADKGEGGSFEKVGQSQQKDAGKEKQERKIDKPISKNNTCCEGHALNTISK